MPTLLTLTLPPEALERLMDGYRRRDPELLKMLEDLGVLEIRPHDEGRCATDKAKLGK